MDKKDDIQERTIAFVRKALSQTSRGPVKESTVQAVAQKVKKAVPTRREQEQETTPA
jgi:hypothetical protein